MRALSAEDVRKRFGDSGLEVVANTPAEFAGVIRAELAQWAKLIKDAGIKFARMIHSAAMRCTRAYSQRAVVADRLIGVKSLCAIHSARVNLVMWFEQAQNVT